MVAVVIELQDCVPVGIFGFSYLGFGSDEGVGDGEYLSDARELGVRFLDCESIFPAFMEVALGERLFGGFE